MNHERPTSPERLEDRSLPVFNLDAFSPGQVMELSAAIGKSLEAELERDDAPQDQRYADQLVSILAASLDALARQSPEKGVTLFETMSNHVNPWQREMAQSLALALLERLDGDDIQQRTLVIEQLVSLLDDPDEQVSEAAYHSFAEAQRAGLVDEQIARRLIDRLPGDYQETYARASSDTADRS